jgi:hypothetical protein
MALVALLIVLVGLGFRVDAAGASNPLTIGPFVQQGPENPLEVAEAEGGNSGMFGFSVAISGDGKTALVGAPGANGFAGAAWVFTRSGGAWIQQGPKLTGGEASGAAEECSEEAGEAQGECGFGHSVALSADGNTAVIGAPRDNEQRGAAWVYTRSGSTWTQGPELSDPGEGAGGRFGRTVALSADGETALVGAPATNSGRGLAWVFTRSAGGWVSEGALSGSGAEGESRFGFGLALSADGANILIGAPGNAGRAGAAWAFRRSGSTLTQNGPELTGPGEIGEGRFGYSVALSGDASTALVGARSDDADSGAVWTFANAGSGFAQQGVKLTAQEAGTGEFGYTVALSADGSIALVGEPHGGHNHGTASLLARSGEGWAFAKEYSAGAAPKGSGSFGLSLGLSSEGGLALVGTPNYEGRTGAVFPFGPDPTIEAMSPTRGPAAGGTTVTITGANLAGARAVTFGSTPAASFTVTSATTITAVSPPGFGKVDVTVTTAYGTSAITPLDVFAYSKHLGVGGGELEEVTGATSTAGTPIAAAPAGGVLGAGPLAGGICGVSLRSRSITVQGRGRAAVKLLLTGTGRCSGRLTLKVRRKIAHHRYLVRTIAAGNFAITGKSRTITLKLNARGRALLRAGHGRLSAQLSVLRSSPAPRLARISNVRLAKAKPRRPVKAKR